MDNIYEGLEIGECLNYAYIDVMGHRTAPISTLPDGCTWTGTGIEPYSSYILFEDIDLTDVDIPLISFVHSARASNVSFFDFVVEYSLNDGTDWTTFDIVTAETIDESGFDYGPEELGLPGIANQSNVDIRFRHTSHDFTAQDFEDYGIPMAWMIDDIKIFDYSDLDIPYDLVVKDTRINFFDYIDYTLPEWAEYNVFHYSSYYGQAPQEQFASAEGGFLWFNISLENQGTETVTPKVNVKVTNPNDVVVFDQVVDGVLTPFTGADTLDMTEVDCILPLNTNDPAQVLTGRYEVTYNAYVEGHEADDNYPTDNVDTAYFYVSDNVFSREADDINGYTGPGYWGVGGNDGDGIGSSFTIYYEDDIASVDVFIDENTSIGTMINAEICVYETDAWGSPVLTSDPLIIDETHLGQWVNITFEDSYSVTFGAEETYKELLVGIICYYNGDNDIYIGESTMNNHSSYSAQWKFTSEGSEWRGISNYAGGPAIRLNYGIENDETGNTIVTELEEISLYPNPTTGVLYLEGVEGADVQISNMMGQVVESIENANEYNQVDMSSYANGTYFVKVVVDNKVTTRKINLMK